MSGDHPSASDTPAALSLGELRGAFDRSFALPPPPPSAETEEFVAIRLGPEPCALAVRDLARLEAARPVVPLPVGRAGLLGMAGIRGRLVPVFGLAALLGLEGSRDAPRWFALTGRDDGRAEGWTESRADGRDEPLAFAFDRFDGHLAVPRTALDMAGSAGLRPHVRHILRWGDGPPRLVIDVPALAASLHAAARHPRKA